MTQENNNLHHQWATEVIILIITCHIYEERAKQNLSIHKLSDLTSQKEGSNK